MHLLHGFLFMYLLPSIQGVSGCCYRMTVYGWTPFCPPLWSISRVPKCHLLPQGADILRMCDLCGGCIMLQVQKAGCPANGKTGVLLACSRSCTCSKR